MQITTTHYTPIGNIVSDESNDVSASAISQESEFKMNRRNVSLVAESTMKKSASHPHHAVAEFLFQLIKMLNDDNREYIEWINGE